MMMKLWLFCWCCWCWCLVGGNTTGPHNSAIDGRSSSTTTKPNTTIHHPIHPQHHHTNHSHPHNHTHLHHTCNRPWPQTEFFILLGFSTKDTSRNSEWKDLFLQSFLFFWPVARSKASIVFIMDEELEGTDLLKHALIDELERIRQKYQQTEQARTQFPTIRLMYHQHSDRLAWNRTTNEVNYEKLPYKGGYDRQQYMGFIADQYTNATYIAMADRDTLFSTFVHEEDIFHEGKAIVHGKLQRILKKTHGSLWAVTTYDVLKREMPMNCMSYFPVVIKRKHLQDFRDYVMKLHNMKSFDEVYERIFVHEHNAGWFSQYCIICTYLFWFHRDEYVWHLHDRDPSWDGNNPVPILGHYGDKSMYTAEEKKLTAYVSLHARYRFHRLELIDNQFNMHAFYLQSMCSYGALQTLHYPNVNCSVFTSHFEYFDEVFAFEEAQYDDVHGRSVAKQVFDERLQHFEGCSFDYANASLYFMLEGHAYKKEDFNRMLSMKLRN